jgi:hypothetical protein
VTYDEWKLESPEDERARRWAPDPLRCLDCGVLNHASEGSCRNCDSVELEQDSGPDPDDARDAAMDRGDFEFHRDYDQ